MKPIEGQPLIRLIKETLNRVETTKREQEEQLAYMAHHDALTGLANRILLGDKIELGLQTAKHGPGLALHLMDIDHFQIINDTFGHPAGDELLKAVAGRLSECIRKDDTIARVEGDKFAIVQNFVHDATEATKLAERFQEVFEVPFELNGEPVLLGASGGIALAPNDGQNAEKLLKKADLALLRAKDDGRGHFRYFESDADARMKAHRALITDLSLALRNGEFELFFQPLFNLRENKVTSFETLLRWNHPKRGIVGPDEFISVAEEYGLIGRIGEWVLKSACAEAATWPEDINIAVNLSPLQFKSDNLEQHVMDALTTSGLSAKRLELEITESILLQDNANTFAILHQLRDLGVRIAMDDFGTGYSSLSYLSSFPFDKLKIDRSFVKDLTTDSNGVSIITAITGIAAAFGMTTTAEGVETEEQRSIVRKQGCTEMQGFLFSRPVPTSEIGQFFAAD